MPSNIPLWTRGAALRLRLVTFTEHAHRAYRPLGGILAWRRGSSDRSSARRPLPQAPQWHPRVASGASIGTLARGPSTEPLLGQGHVARLSGTGVKPVSCRCFGRTSARHPRREASRWHPGVARQSSIGSSSIKSRCSMDVEVRIGCLSMKCRCFMDVALTRPPGCPKSRHFRTQSAFCNTLKGQNRLKG